MGVDDFAYNAEHRVVVCQRCGTCLMPGGPKQWKYHLRRRPHGMRGERLRRVIELLSTYDLREKEELRRWRPGRRTPCERIIGLSVYAGYLCKCDSEKCDFATRRLATMHDHMPSHGRTASQHNEESPLWEACSLQTYFTAKGRIDYFTVKGEDSRRRNGIMLPTPPRVGTTQPVQCTGAPPSSPETQLFEVLRQDVKQAARDLDDKAAVVEDIGDERADREPWLVYTGFPAHLRGLSDGEIKSSFNLPKKVNILLRGEPGMRSHAISGDDKVTAPEVGGQEEEDLQRILETADRLFRSAYKLVADRSLNRKMTHQRAQRLSDFAWGAGKKGKDTAFRPFKNESTLTTYFRRMKELLVYFYRVVHREDGHFTRGAEEEDRCMPQDTMEPTGEQRRAMNEMLDAAREERGQGEWEEGGSEDRDEDEGRGSRLACGIRRFYIALICHTTGSKQFRSPVISFCAMLSRTTVRSMGDGGKIKRRNIAKGTGNAELDEAARRQKGRGCWQEPGNYSSNLSALVWMAQLLIFEAACFYKEDGDEDEILSAVETLCRDFMHQAGETAFGHILQWRLYLSTVAKSAISKNQARWSLEGQEIDYLGTKLRMEHVSELVVSEYQRARALLYDELLFRAREIVPVEAWRLHDDLDLEDYGGSWLTDPRNADLLDGRQDVLLQQIEKRSDLRRVFVRDGQDESRNGNGNGSGGSDGSDGSEEQLCRKAMAVYEAHVQEFLQSLVPLLHVSPAPPVRAPELFAITHANGSRRRSMLIWERMLMVYIRYHKSQELTGKATDNIRFIPNAIAELVLTFLAIVQPLRQTFLRQVKPGALLSPYLFSTLDGEVWRDELASKCLSRACKRAQVPEIKVAWWRQAAASITKEKFTPKERANFNMEDITAPETIEEEEAIVDLAEASNHSFRTFNHAYAGSTTLTMSTLLHRARRASLSWRSLFRVDELLAEEIAGVSRSKRPGQPTMGPDDIDGQMLRAYKKVRLRSRPLCREKVLLTAARGLYNDPDLQLRQPGQRDAMLASMGPNAAEQVVVVLATGSGKSLIVMVAAVLEGAATTIMVLPTVALRGNMLGRLEEMGIRTIVWSPGQRRSAPLILVSAEAACTEGFVEYANRLESRQQLDRIVIDECHLTITANSYRESMKQLGWHVRRVRTQTVWLTATLPPLFEPGFTEHNLLVRPHIIRESTNRANIRYIVRRFKGVGGLRSRAAELVRSCAAMFDRSSSSSADGCEGLSVAGGAKARIIVYCQTIDLMKELAEELGCPMYTGDREYMSEEEKEAAIGQWLGPTGLPAIVATSALGVGFDYPYVRWVIHAGPPRRMTDFSQESGRAGRDGQPAESIVLLSKAWRPYSAGQEPEDADEESMQLYLTQQYCSRAVMSQFLDARLDWRWCMEGEDELCSVCPIHHTQQRPAGLTLSLPPPEKVEDVAMDRDDHMGGRDKGASNGNEHGNMNTAAARTMQYTGPEEVLRQTRIQEEIIIRFEADMELMRGYCLLCRVERRPFDHAAASCSRRRQWINAKAVAIRSCKQRGRPWMPDYAVCFLCYMPQTICRRADPEGVGNKAHNGDKGTKELECRFRDMIIPLCYGAFFQVGPRALITKHFGQFRNIEKYMWWLGEAASLGRTTCVQANCVAARLLAELG